MNNFYVYAYFEANEPQPFYIGKGCGHRSHAHMMPSVLYSKDTAFYRKLREIIHSNSQPRIVYIETGLTDDEACELEKKLINTYGRKDQGSGCLLNGVGWRYS